MKHVLLTLALATATLTVASAAPTTWKADAAHSSVAFKIRHFFAKVPGSFTTLDATVVFDPENVTASTAEATIAASSITTANDRRDTHLKSDDFFNAEKFPNIQFKSTSWKKIGDDTYEITGDLTIRDVTKPVTLQAKFLGEGPGPRGKRVSGWEAKTTLKRQDFGVSFVSPALGDEVEIEIQLEANA